jgi:hypothetical protein
VTAGGSLTIRLGRQAASSGQSGLNDLALGAPNVANIDAHDAAQDRAREIVDALGGWRNGKGWVCHCPTHLDVRPSLSVGVKNGKVLIHCYAHCPQDKVIDTLKGLGLWRSDTSPARRLLDRIKRARERKSALHACDRDQGRELIDPSCDPLRSWRNSYVVFRGTWAEIYHSRRALDLTDAEISQLHTHPGLFHWPSRSRWPAVIWLVRKWDGFRLADLTVTQTFLAHYGATKAPVPKARLFPAGVSPVGGGVWFGEPDPEREFVVAEGVESTLSAMRLLGAENGCAALSTLGIRELILPPAARRVCIFADRDPNGQGLEAARAAWRRWPVEGREVRVAMPNVIGWDANNILMRRAGRG